MSSAASRWGSPRVSGAALRLLLKYSVSCTKVLRQSQFMLIAWCRSDMAKKNSWTGKACEAWEWALFCVMQNKTYDEIKFWVTSCKRQRIKLHAKSLESMKADLLGVHMQSVIKLLVWKDSSQAWLRWVSYFRLQIMPCHQPRSYEVLQEGHHASACELAQGSQNADSSFPHKPAMYNTSYLSLGVLSWQSDILSSGVHLLAPLECTEGK